jgi:hypothetical protein
MPENEKTMSELEKLGISYMLVNPNPDGKMPVSDQVASLRRFAEKFIGKSDYIAS